MSDLESAVPQDENEDNVATVDTAEANDEATAAASAMKLDVQMEDTGPCKKHVRVRVARENIDEVFDSLVEEYAESAEVPGFRTGHVPTSLVRKRFRKELNDQVKQRVLMLSLEQLGEESNLNPISEPNLDLDSIELPEEGDFEYEFDVEVRPEFDLPEYKGLKIDRPVREISDADVEAYLRQFLDQYGTQVPIEEPASAGDFVTVDVEFTHGDKPLHKIEELSIRVRPTLRFQDAEITGFEEGIVGASVDDVREFEFPVSMEAENIALRGETIKAKFTILDVKRLEAPALDDDFLERINVDSVESLRDQIRSMLERQVTYEQRQSCRAQVLEQITDSADWDLPESLLQKQSENALRREILEMQQSGFTSKEIMARENDLRQQSLSMTRKNLKEHFVLDRIAEQEDITVTDEDLNLEITYMALQRGENPRRVRARLQKSGMIENLDAQIRERKAVDVILENANFNDVPAAPPTEPNVEALDRSVFGDTAPSAIEDEDDGEE